MSEERFDRLEKMMELVISTMATKDNVASLNAKIDSLDAKVERYGQACVWVAQNHGYEVD